MSVELKKLTHIIDEQFAAEEKMLQEIKAGSFSLENPYVKLNPYIIAPLTALVYFKTDAETEATVLVKGKENAGDMTFTFPTGKEHHLPIYGLYAGHANQVEITLCRGPTKTLTTQTEKAPGSVHMPRLITPTPEYLEGNVIFASPASPGRTAAYDHTGDVRRSVPVTLTF